MSCTVCSPSGNQPLVGDRPTIEMTFKDRSKPPELADPNAITVRVRFPDATVIEWTLPDPEITQVTLGIWEFQFPDPLLVAGEYRVYVVAEGGGVDKAAQTSFELADTFVPLV